MWKISGKTLPQTGPRMISLWNNIPSHMHCPECPLLRVNMGLNSCQVAPIHLKLDILCLKSLIQVLLDWT